MVHGHEWWMKELLKGEGQKFSVEEQPVDRL